MARTIGRDDSEFGGGPGMIDPQSRQERLLDPPQQLWEIYATNPALPDLGGQGDTATLDDENFPETATVERP